MDSDICPIVYSIAKHDDESYVRASALNCLTEMMNVEVFWTECLAQLDIVPYLMDVLYTESEGVVRREGVVLLTAIYRKKLLPRKGNLDQIFSIMAYCAVNDLYWEVKTNALKFWKEVMCTQFQHQGVIDNTFPAVTFSKEHKKIVQLTQKEILRRLTEVLKELAMRGSLGIFLHCLDDSSDLEVVKVATSIVQRLQMFLDRYHYMEEVVNRSGDSPPIWKPTMDTNFVRDQESNILTEFSEERSRNSADLPSNGNRQSMRASTSSEGVIESNRDADGVIEAIVEAQDVNLLAHAYENQLQVEAGAGVDGTEKELIPEVYYKQFATVTPVQFLRRVYSMDLEKWAEERATWIAQIENFDSLLDDILLGLEKQGEAANDADCY